MTTPKKPRKKKKGNKKNYYFTLVHEQAIIRYSITESSQERTELYINYIQPAFDEMVNKIVYTYKFTSLPNIEYLKDDCKIWLTTILDKYDPNKGSKAFSYFSVITKNWFIHKVKKTKFRNEREVYYDDIFKEADDETMVAHHEYEIKREKKEFWESFFDEINSWDSDLFKENEKKVLEAVKILFESSEDIEIFNKKAIYLYLREITGLNTKQVVNNLKKMRLKYGKFKKRWNEGTI
tara:strand:- start:698 stop:1408 length:711 start_codon:yes stop_codon:yes gene_type:complete